MDEIHDALKKITVLNEKNAKLDRAIDTQSKAEMIIDQKTEEFQKKLDMLEAEVRQKGLSLSQAGSEIEFTPYESDQLQNHKKLIEKHSLKAIHKKFYTVIFKQKEKVIEMLSDHNSSIDAHIEQMSKLREGYN